jgi:hypothetical protein
VVGLWVIQVLLAAVFAFSGVFTFIGVVEVLASGHQVLRECDVATGSQRA